MAWTLTHDPDAFAECAVPILARDPVANTLVLGIVDTLRSGLSYSDRVPVFGWQGDGEPGALLMTPPYEMILAELRTSDVVGVVASLRKRGIEVPGVNADDRVAEAFARAWTEGTTLSSRIVRHQRLYRLDRLLSLAHPADGTARRATPGDQPLLVDWLRAFFVEVDLMDSVSDMALASRIDEGRLWMWDDTSGAPVAFAGRQKTLGEMTRVGPVYTPPERRRRGYGAAVTAACTEDALARGAEQVLLFTDLANPTSNSIYQQIGYRPVSDSTVIRFVGGPSDRNG